MDSYVLLGVKMIDINIENLHIYNARNVKCEKNSDVSYQLWVTADFIGEDSSINNIHIHIPRLKDDGESLMSIDPADGIIYEVECNDS